ncbi:MAG: hypothetical protein U9Q89_09555 [Thermodesulfobacteriota bacterium]|nr:hypothetical protein [Thermodesulfobacteriota bacterium]
MTSLLAGVWLSVAEAAEVTWTPRVDARLEYDDNINFSDQSKDKEQDWIYKVQPELTWRRRTDRDDLRFTACLLGQKYDTWDELDTLDQDYRLMASSQVRPTLGLSFDGRYRKDTTQDSELSDEGMRFWREDRKEYRLQPSMHWQATERSSWKVALSFRQVNYEGSDNDKGDDNEDYKTSRTILTYSYLLADDRTSVFAEPNFYYADYEHGNTRVYVMAFGVDTAFSERLTLRASGGVSFSRDRDDYGTSNDRSFEASVEAQWKLERGRWHANYTRRYYPSGDGETVMRDRFTFSGHYRLMNRLNFAGSASFTKVKSESDWDKEDYWNIGISPGLVYRLTERANLGIYYRHRFLKDNEDDEDTRRNQIWIRLDFAMMFER